MFTMKRFILLMICLVLTGAATTDLKAWEIGNNVFPGDPTEAGRIPPIRCLIVGEVLWPNEDIEPRLRLTTGCPIQIQREGNRVRMSSTKWIVEVAIPETPYAQGFLYIWGFREASIGNHLIKVSYGPADGA